MYNNKKVTQKLVILEDLERVIILATYNLLGYEGNFTESILCHDKSPEKQKEFKEAIEGLIDKKLIKKIPSSSLTNEEPSYHLTDLGKRMVEILKINDDSIEKCKKSSHPIDERNKKGDYGTYDVKVERVKIERSESGCHAPAASASICSSVHPIACSSEKDSGLKTDGSHSKFTELRQRFFCTENKEAPSEFMSNIFAITNNDPDYYTPFLDAIRNRKYEQALRIACNVPLKNSHYKDVFELIKLLLLNKKILNLDINARGSVSEKTAYDHAVKNKNQKLCDYLIEHGAIPPSESAAATTSALSMNLSLTKL